MRTALAATILIAPVLTALAGCTTAVQPVDVTRFHLGAPITRGSIAPSGTTGGTVAGLEAATYAAAVERELVRLGYTIGRPETAALTYAVDVTSDTREGLARRSPVTIGVGGGSFGGGVGGGVGASFGLGGNRSATTVVTRMSVRIAERGGSTVWEGRAEGEAPSNARAAQPGISATRLAAALFREFPGESGRTVSVR